MYRSAAEGSFGSSNANANGTTQGSARAAWATPADPFGGFQAVALGFGQLVDTLGGVGQGGGCRGG